MFVDPTFRRALTVCLAALSCVLVAGGTARPAVAGTEGAVAAARAGAILGEFSQGALDAADLCAAAIDAAERDYRMPSKLLRAISLGESGRWLEDEGRSVSWPWTVTNGGSGQYFPTKQAAIAEVRRLWGKGERNIDVGCMQINLRAHPEAFDTLESAFDPQTNVAYSADFLDKLREQQGSWQMAVGYYHSATPELNKRYRDKIADLWNKLLRNPEPAPRSMVAAIPRPVRPQTMARLTAPPANATPFFLSLVNRAPGTSPARQASISPAGSGSIASGRPGVPGQPQGRSLSQYRSGAVAASSLAPLGSVRIVAD
jgi:hypothetical protein